MKTVFTMAFVLMASASAFADGGDWVGADNNYSAPVPASVHVINYESHTGPAPACSAGFEPVYDMCYHSWQCLPVTGGGNGSG